MRKIKFFNEQYYHIYNRGIEKRKIFLDEPDYWRFIQGMYEFNDSQTKTHNKHLARKPAGQSLALTIEPLVDILCYCLMPNHFHFLIKQRNENSISNFMHRLGTGYTKYFNKRYERTGRLFEGVFKAKLINKENYFLHISRYIHLNPIKLIIPNWKKVGVRDWKMANNYLENYRWSSYSTYLGLNNYPLVSKEILTNIFKSSTEYKRFVNEWMIKDIDKVKKIFK